jgi:FKBP-type peptidyl-prolyl cis-trans isomerase FkpA
MKLWQIAIAGGFFGLGLCGCEEPSAIVPVAPPGANIPRVSPDADPAQALGETAPASSSPTASPKKSPAAAEPSTAALALATAQGETKTTPGGVKYETLKQGKGPELQPGQKAVMHYEGKLENGSPFDSSRTRMVPFEVAIGTGRVIKGWDEAIPGMKVGEVRKLTIPATMGYGPQGMGSKIPPNATLIFEVELLEIK